MVDPQYQHPRHRGRRGEDHHGGVVHADDRGLVSRRQALHHRHQEHRHVQHRLDSPVRYNGGGGGTEKCLSYRDAQCDFLSRLCRNQKDKSRQEKSLDILPQSVLSLTVPRC